MRVQSCTLKAMRLPRKGILIRFAIYGLLLGYFGWQAINHYLAEREAEASAAGSLTEDELPRRAYTLPDGRSIEVLEITPEQAERMYGVPPSAGPAEPPEAGKSPHEPSEPAEAPTPGNAHEPAAAGD